MTWTTDDLDRIGTSEELQVASGRADGALSAYHAKYDRYGAGIVGSVVGTAAREVTIHLVLAEGGE